MNYDPAFIIFVAVMAMIFSAIYLFDKFGKNKITAFYYSQYQADKEDGIVRMDNGMALMRETSGKTKHVFHDGKWQRYTFMSEDNKKLDKLYPHLNLKLVCRYEDYSIAINEKVQSGNIPFSYQEVIQ